MKTASRVLCVALLALVSDNAAGQIVKPDLTPPPCQGRNCPNQAHGATIPSQKHAASACPTGTVRDPSKGTCHVLP